MDGDPLRCAGGAIGRPQLPAWPTLSSTAEQAVVADELAAELVPVQLHRVCELVDHQLGRGYDVRAVDVADAAGVERVVVVGLVDQLVTSPKLYGTLGQREHHLGVAEVAQGLGRERRREDLPEPMLKSVATLVCRWSNVNTLFAR